MRYVVLDRPKYWRSIIENQLRDNSYHRAPAKTLPASVIAIIGTGSPSQWIYFVDIGGHKYLGSFLDSDAPVIKLMPDAINMPENI
jgi:hypothetical protein